MTKYVQRNKLALLNRWLPRVSSCGRKKGRYRVEMGVALPAWLKGAFCSWRSLVRGSLCSSGFQSWKSRTKPMRGDWGEESRGGGYAPPQVVEQ